MLAAPILARVAVKLHQRTKPRRTNVVDNLLYKILIKIVPDGDDLADAKANAIHLGDEDSGDRFVEGGAVHVDRRPDGDDETRHPRVDLVVLLETAEGDRQRHRAIYT